MLDKKMEIDKKAVGLRIREIRIKNGHTLKSFGELFGAKKGNVQQWEIGRSLPSKDRIYKISKFANITINQLLYGDEQDIEELYQELIKLPKEELIILMLKIAQNKGEKK